MAATGQSEPRQGEADLRPETITGALSSPASKAAVERNHALLSRAAQAVDRIIRGCMVTESRPFSPSIRPVLATIAEMQQLIAQARSDLHPWSDTAGNAGTTLSPGGDPDASAEADASLAETTVTPAPLPRTAIPDRATAAATLSAVETYFARHEPASAALLLITQSRMLLGKSLVDALELLLPDAAPRAAVSFGPNGAFVLNMDRLRMLSKASGAGDGAAADPDPSALRQPASFPVEVADRRAAAAHLAGVEEFFRIREPASPIPMLLALARSYLDKDFSAIVTAIVPPPAPAPG